MSKYMSRIDAEARFDSARGSKSDLFAGERLFAGLNCFEPGQSQQVHVHAGADKLYFLASGRARMRVGDDAFIAEAGAVVWAPADVPHGVEEALERTVMLVAMAPPPGGRR